MRYEIDFTRLIHREGAKEYAIDFITREDGAVLLIFQWGKAGAKGQLQSHFFKPSERRGAYAKRNKKIGEKRARGYVEEAHAMGAKMAVVNYKELERYYRVFSTKSWWLRIPENHRKLITGDIFENPNAQELVVPQAEMTNIDMAALYANHPLFGKF